MDEEKFEEIRSLQNPRVKQCVKLRDRRDRDETSLFLIEGYRELLRATDAGRAVETLFICPALFLGDNELDLIRRVRERGAQVLDCTESVFHKMSYRDRPDGLLAVAPQSHLALGDLAFPPAEPPFLVVAQSVEKPGNLGTLLRSADASGVHGVIVCDRCTDIHNPNVVRASVGTLFTVPVVEAAGAETRAYLRERKIRILAASPSAGDIYTDVDLSGGIAIAVGTEQYGLSAEWLDEADIRARIPMLGKADSLNVAMAATLMMFEVRRRRGVSGD